MAIMTGGKPPSFLFSFGKLLFSVLFSTLKNYVHIRRYTATQYIPSWDFKEEHLACVPNPNTYAKKYNKSTE